VNKEPVPLSRVLGGEPDEVAVQQMWHKISDRLERRSRKWLVALPAVAIAAAVVLFAVLRSDDSTPQPRSAGALTAADGASIERIVASAEGPLHVALSDGTQLSLGPGAELRTAVNSPAAVTMHLDRGASTFQVAKIPGRTFTVRCAGVEVVVTGTRFRVERYQGAVGVQVEEGSVRVIDTHGRRRDLRAGDALRISTSVEQRAAGETGSDSGSGETGAPPANSASLRSSDLKTSAGADFSSRNPTSGSASPGRGTSHSVGSGSGSGSDSDSGSGSGSGAVPRWLVAARRGDGARALALAGPRGFTRSQMDPLRPEDLMLLADLARGEGRPELASLPLLVLTEKHSEDRLAPLAAFSLGKLWLVELDQPKLAAGAFEQALGLGLPRSLREQAFARRAEAYARAGDSKNFARAARLYRETFPAGKLLDESERWQPE
jgi:transmembrane sensor